MPSSTLHDLATSDDPLQVLAMCPSSVAGLPISVLPIPGSASSTKDFHESPRIFVAQSGYGRRWVTRGARSFQLQTAPKMVEVYEAELEFERTRWQGTAGRCVMVEFADADVDRLTHGQIRSLQLRTQHEVLDPRLSALTLELADEALFGLPKGDLYVQGLAISVLGVLVRGHTRDSRELGSVERSLTPAQCRRITELVSTEFGSKLSLDRMAREVNLSPFHFSRLFKRAFGTTPHKFVQQARIDAAVEALRSGEFPTIAAVALACGFSSHSHMTDLLRRRLGVSPGSLRP